MIIAFFAVVLGISISDFIYFQMREKSNDDSEGMSEFHLRLPILNFFLVFRRRNGETFKTTQ
jgi:hypothetical protein